MVRSIIIKTDKKNIPQECYDLNEPSFEKGQLHINMSKNQRLMLTFLASLKSMTVMNYMRLVITEKFEEFVKNNGKVLYNMDESVDNDKHVFYIMKEGE